MNTKSYKSEVFAKINLSLEITGKVRNLHTLKMLVCPYAGFKDVVEFVPKDDRETVTGDRIDNGQTVAGDRVVVAGNDENCTGENRIVDVQIKSAFNGFDGERFKAFFLPKAEAIAKKLGVSGRLLIDKGVPLGAGLGGSSASVVAALKSMLAYAKDFGKSTALDNGFLLGLGSDVPCMLYGKTCIVEGVGEVIKPVDFDAKDLCVEIADGGSDTKECYALYDKLKAENADVDTSVCLGVEIADDYECLELAGESVALFKNDLTLPASTLNKNIKNLICDLKKDYRFVFLSGSGSAVVYKTRKY